MSFQVVIITGAASGIGAAIALSFAKQNAGLCITDINEEDLHKTSIECQKFTKNKVLEIVADLRKDEDQVKVVKSALKEFGRIDVLVNSAGVYQPSKLQDSDIIKKFDKIIEINLRSVVALTNKTLPALIESKGCIINISSVCTAIVVSDTLAYAMAKTAIITFTKHVAFELARFGVRVNCISPGPVMTNLLKNAGFNDRQLHEYWNDLRENMLMKKLVKAEEIAEMAVYLASDKAASINGTDFLIDGGMALGTVDHNTINYNLTKQ